MMSNLHEYLLECLQWADDDDKSMVAALIDDVVDLEADRKRFEWLMKLDGNKTRESIDAGMERCPTWRSKGDE